MAWFGRKRTTDRPAVTLPASPAVASGALSFEELADRCMDALAVEAVRKLVFQTMDGIRGALSRHRSRQEERLHRLGEVLRGLRSDLLEMRLKAELDPLTQLYNRGAFDNASRRYVTLSHFAGQSLCLLMIDLDHFKQVNDQYGHPAGDRVLRAAAAALLRAFPRRSDLVARYGDLAPRPRIVPALGGPRRAGALKEAGFCGSLDPA